MQETQLALLSVPTASSIVVDKAEVENDDHLKKVIKKYFNRRNFRWWSHKVEMLIITELSAKSISGTTFIVDIKYEQVVPGVRPISTGRATANIEKTVDSFKIISFDRKR